MRMVSFIVGSLFALMIGSAALLVCFSIFWPGKRIYFSCTEEAGSTQHFGMLYERYPAWVFWADDDGTVFVEKGGFLAFFHTVKEDKLDLTFDAGPSGMGNGRLSKITLRASILMKDGDSYFGNCVEVNRNWGSE